MSISSQIEAGVTLDGVTKRFGSIVAVDDVSVEIQPGEFFSLLGPSGCGKTTLLRIVGGFERPDAGSVHIAGRDVTGMNPQRRPTAMVFQSYALFPNMTVGENVAYGLRVRKVDASTRRRRVEEALRRVELEALVERPVTALSGGQQQRVALARAVAVEPDVLLFDEPLSNLDVTLREQTRRELKVLQHRLGTTSLYVTHDQQEALALSDRIAVMKAGRLIQVGPPEQLYREPETAYVAEFLGGSNIVRDRRLASRLAGGDPPPGRVLAVRPEHFEVSSNGVEAQVVSRQFLGTLAEWWVEVDGLSLRAWLDPGEASVDRIRLAATSVRWVRDDRVDGPARMNG
ncbi:MAG: ABC transporter ATP-binding protein [Rhodothermales bacterium]